MGSHLSLFAGLGTWEWGLFLDSLWLQAASLEGRVRPEPGSAVFQILSYTEKEARGRCRSVNSCLNMQVTVLWRMLRRNLTAAVNR